VRRFWGAAGYFAALTAAGLAGGGAAWWIAQGAFGLPGPEAQTVASGVTALVAAVLLIVRPFRGRPVSAKVPPPPPPTSDTADGAGLVLCGQIPLEPVGYLVRREVQNALAATDGVSVIYALTGRRGVGKTMEAATLARSRRAEGWDVAWVNAGSGEQVRAGFAEIADVLGIRSEGEQADRAAAVALRTLSAGYGRRVLTVFDNVTEPGDVLNWIPRGGEVAVVVTTTDASATQLGRGVAIEPSPPRRRSGSWPSAAGARPTSTPTASRRSSTSCPSHWRTPRRG